MGYLNNNTVTVEAILTKKGRELLAKGLGGFKITQFAVADDEIDYSLWAPTHPLGTAFYGSIIEAMPLVEAVPDETQCMRYKLVTLPRNTPNIPIVKLNYGAISIAFGDGAFSIAPTTTGAGTNASYTAILYDSTIATITSPNTGGGVNTGVAYLGGSGETSTANAMIITGVTFNLSPISIPAAVTTKLTIIGNDTGGTITIPVTVSPQPVSV